MSNPHLYMTFCSRPQRTFSKIAVEEGWLYGSQFTADDVMLKTYQQLMFADVDYKRWRNPAPTVSTILYLQRYAQWIQFHRPMMVTIPDIEQDGDLDMLLSYAEQSLSPYVQFIIVIPKQSGIIDKIPKTIGGSTVWLGYSVPTSYGGTNVHLQEFGQRPVHLLGGMPNKQLELSYYLNVVSMDCNSIQKLATKRCLTWRSDTYRFHPTNQYYECGDMLTAFRQSCIHVKQVWEALGYTVNANM